MTAGFSVGDWCAQPVGAALPRDRHRQDVWGEVAYRVWLPAEDVVVRARAQEFGELTSVRPAVDSGSPEGWRESPVDRAHSQPFHGRSHSAVPHAVTPTKAGVYLIVLKEQMDSDLSRNDEIPEYFEVST